MQKTMSCFLVKSEMTLQGAFFVLFSDLANVPKLFLQEDDKFMPFPSLKSSWYLRHFFSYISQLSLNRRRDVLATRWSFQGKKGQGSREQQRSPQASLSSVYCNEFI